MRIGDLQRRQGMPQAELTAELGINRFGVSNYETGEARIRAVMLGAWRGRCACQPTISSALRVRAAHAGA